MGRFLREAGKVDKTRAGTMLTASGRTMSFIANKRVLLRNPLVKLYQDVETFQYRAVTDTYETIDKMERARTGYRAALLWMKDISSKLDPDTYKQLEKFRKVQAHVRRCKARFEKIKIDTYQKIDMLSASRVNMFSHSLGLYQKEWLSFYEKSSKVMNEVDEAFAGYQYYDFNILKQLAEPQRKAIHAGGLVNSDLEKKLNSILESGEGKSTSAGEDKLYFFDPVGSGSKIVNDNGNKIEGTSEFDLLGLSEPKSQSDTTPIKSTEIPSGNFGSPGTHLESKSNAAIPKNREKRKLVTEKSKETPKSSTLNDLLTAAEPDERELLNEIFAGPIIAATPNPTNAGGSLLDELMKCGVTDPSSHGTASDVLRGQSNKDLLTGSGEIDIFQQLKFMKQPDTNQGALRREQENPTDKWLNLFAELDPLANPDAIGKDTLETEQDRTC